MDYGLYRYDEPYSRPIRRRINYFGWTVAILLLTGFAFAAWLGSFYIFSQPERPDSYRILQKLHKVDPPKRFELTAAPGGEFLSAKQLYDRYNTMGSAELAKTNAELAINYHEVDFVAATLRATEGRGADVILDMVGGDYLARNVAAAALEGRIALIATQGGTKAELDLRPL